MEGDAGVAGAGEGGGVEESKPAGAGGTGAAPWDLFIIAVITRGETLAFFRATRLSVESEYLPGCKLTTFTITSSLRPAFTIFTIDSLARTS